MEASQTITVNDISAYLTVEQCDKLSVLPKFITAKETSTAVFNSNILAVFNSNILALDLHDPNIDKMTHYDIKNYELTHDNVSGYADYIMVLKNKLTYFLLKVRVTGYHASVSVIYDIRDGHELYTIRNTETLNSADGKLFIIEKNDDHVILHKIELSDDNDITKSEVEFDKKLCLYSSISRISENYLLLESNPKNHELYDINSGKIICSINDKYILDLLGLPRPFAYDIVWKEPCIFKTTFVLAAHYCRSKFVFVYVNIERGDINSIVVNEPAGLYNYKGMMAINKSIVVAYHDAPNVLEFDFSDIHNKKIKTILHDSSCCNVDTLNSTFIKWSKDDNIAKPDTYEKLMQLILIPPHEREIEGVHKKTREFLDPYLLPELSSIVANYVL